MPVSQEISNVLCALHMRHSRFFLCWIICIIYRQNTFFSNFSKFTSNRHKKYHLIDTKRSRVKKLYIFNKSQLAYLMSIKLIANLFFESRLFFFIRFRNVRCLVDVGWMQWRVLWRRDDTTIPQVHDSWFRKTQSRMWQGVWWTIVQRWTLPR